MDTTYSIDTIYNFNLQIGDSVLYDFGIENYYMKIENIDSIIINDEKFKIFPNPVRDELRIKIPNNKKGEYNI